MTTRTFRINVTAPQTGGWSWYNAIGSQSWGRIAATKTIDAAAQPLTSFTPYPNTTSTIITAWNGAQLSEARGEYLLVANGGHADYGGNETYALNLRQNAPEWVRLNAPTPGTLFGDMFTFPNGYASFSDGRSRAMHTQATGNYDDVTDRAWYIHQGAVTGIGSDVPWVASFKRATYGSGVNGYTPASYPGPGNPWVFHRYTGAAGNKFCISAFDPVNRTIWCSSDTGGYPAVWNHKIPADPDAAGTGTFWSNGLGWNFGGNYHNDSMCVADDLRLLIVSMREFRNRFYIKDLSAAENSGWVQVDVADTGFNWNPYSIGSNDNCGCLNYYAPQRALYWMDPVHLGRTVRKLVIPANPMSAASWSSVQWTSVYTEPSTPTNVGGNVTWGSGATAFSATTNGTFNRVRLLKEATAGVASPVLVYAGAVTEATHVFRIT